MESVKDIKMLLLWELGLLKSYYGLVIQFRIFNKLQVSTTPENDGNKEQKRKPEMETQKVQPNYKDDMHI